MEQSRERSSYPPLHFGEVAIEKVDLGSPSTTVANFTCVYLLTCVIVIGITSGITITGGTLDVMVTGGILDEMVAGSSCGVMAFRDA